MAGNRENAKLVNALGAVVAVGTGRGFVVESRGHFGSRDRYVITAAHCLPFFPHCHGFSRPEGRTYEKLLAPLGKQSSVWCESLFVDPIADIAVLASPESEMLYEQAAAYKALVEAATPLKIAEPRSKPIPEEPARLAELEKQMGITGQVEWVQRECPAFLLSLSNEWFSCTVWHFPNDMLNIENAADAIAGGMSGSPIIAEDGSAIGVFCLGSGRPDDDRPSQGGPNPRLMGNLPGWLLNQLADGAA